MENACVLVQILWVAFAKMGLDVQGLCRVKSLRRKKRRELEFLKRTVRLRYRSDYCEGEKK